MYSLGISCYYHDSAAAILKDGHVVAAVEEERFSRKKFDDGFPRMAIDWCLKEAGITPEQINSVAFYDKPVLKFERLLDNYIAVAPRGLYSFLNVIPKWLHKRLWIKEEIKKHMRGYQGNIIFPEHHMSHAAHTFFTSPFDEAAILTVDGVGEWSTSSFGSAENTSIKLTNDIRWPHSIGMFYSAFTYFLGFKVNEGEYKLMGLSAYGKPKYYDLILNEILDMKNDGSLHLNLKYFAFTYDKVMTNQKFAELFGIPRREEDAKAEQIHYDIGASAQKVLEDIMLKMVNHVHKKTGMKNLCLGGGVALNGVANYRILKEGPFESVHIPPSPGDGGSAIGCAQYLYYIHKKQRRIIVQDHAKRIQENVYVGPSFSNDEIRSFLEENNIDYEYLTREQLLQTTAKLISEQNVVGWYQGKIEWGPRALGNRSILADPRDSKMKDVLNEKIKHRELFRPFAPSILEEYVSEYFDLSIPSPYMLFVAKVKKPDKIPAVTHVDGTGRLQTVSREANPLYYDLINDFYKITGVPVVVNTSMNVRGEPIVNTPEQAYAMIIKTEMDYIMMGNYMIQRRDS
uniref:Carbamoyltransferase n=3 Tax=environmental samples TaxID=651140 RepID=A0A075H4V2_9ARCH|nr:carbamoyltransferase [uncultured marine thaumarchaeote KM3_33_G01]AIF08941.1 carbamoyltransferase [uncultured marine thaumarchaeote KM3_33_G02]AIF10854.1 carbamoyltransferase [uncultured marine thaumarchaeote KM3_47_A07]